jgi:hypothetical protein
VRITYSRTGRETASPLFGTGTPVAVQKESEAARAARAARAAKAAVESYAFM